MSEFAQRDLTWVIALIGFREIEGLLEAPGFDGRSVRRLQRQMHTQQDCICF